MLFCNLHINYCFMLRENSNKEDKGTVLLEDKGTVLLSLEVLRLFAEMAKLPIIIIGYTPRGQGRPKGKGEVHIASLP